MKRRVDRMTNEDNPYGNFLEIIRKEAHADGDAPFFIGTVVQPNPLIVKIGDLQIEQENMKVNQALLAGYSRRMFMGTAGATGSTTKGDGISSIGISGGTFTTQDGLKAGEQVVLLKSGDGQQYILLCKVV